MSIWRYKKKSSLKCWKCIERQIDINSINQRALQLIRGLSNWIGELSDSIAELFNSIREHCNWIREISVWILELSDSIKELSNSTTEVSLCVQ